LDPVNCALLSIRVFLFLHEGFPKPHHLPNALRWANSRPSPDATVPHSQLRKGVARPYFDSNLGFLIQPLGSRHASAISHFCYSP
jgi:hypothetical protein